MSRRVLIAFLLVGGFCFGQETSPAPAIKGLPEVMGGPPAGSGFPGPAAGVRPRF